MDLEILKTEKPRVQGKPARTAKLDLEIMLELHREWVQSGGSSGRQVDLSRLNLEGTDLTDSNLQNALLNETVLKGADLLLSDLQGASLLQADLEGANLLGARLRDANLQGANLEGATGLLAAELAGTNLTFAKLPAEISPAEDLKHVARRGRHANGLIVFTLLLEALACWRILTVSDAQMVRNAPLLPFAALRNGLPLIQFFLLCPVLIGGLYLWLHVYLQRLWEAMAALPAIFEDGRRLDSSLPWLVRWPAHSYFPWLRQRRSSLAGVERAMCILLLYWTAPATMVLFWGRYLTMQDLRGTVLQILLIMAAATAAIHFPRSAARPFRGEDFKSTPPFAGGESPLEQRESPPPGSLLEPAKAEPLPPIPAPADEVVAELLQNAVAHSPEAADSAPRKRLPKRRIVSPRIPVAVGFGLILALLSVGTIGGAPHGGSGQGIGAGSPLTWAADAFWLVGYDPFAQVTDSEISRKPRTWTGSDEELDRVEGAGLNGLRLRYLQGYGVFLAKARLRQADLRYAYLSEADLRQANLRQANLRLAVLDRARLGGAMLQSANLANVNLIRADLAKADLSFASLSGAQLRDAKLDSAVLYGADLRGAALERAGFGQADLREANLLGADLSMADLHEAYLSSAKMADARLLQSRLASAILLGADLRRADLSGSTLQSAVLSGADLTNANLQGADLRGAVGLTAAQICSAANAHQAQLDDALGTQVASQCPANR